MGECKGYQMAMEERLKLSNESSMPKVDATRYRNLVGELRYLVHNRPDIAFAVGYLSRFLEDPMRTILLLSSTFSGTLPALATMGWCILKGGGTRLDRADRV
jgi:hypothetical protein